MKIINWFSLDKRQIYKIRRFYKAIPKNVLNMPNL